ncbi:MAG: amidohydrolase family protein [Actinomycetota bacterium]
MRLFDSLTHASADGAWLDNDRYDGGIARLVEELRRIAPSRACLVAIAGYQSNDDIEQFTRQHPDLFVPIAGFDPSKVDGPDEIERQLGALTQRGFAGIKMHPRLNHYDPLDVRSQQTIEAAGRHGLVVFLDTLFRQRDIVTRHPADVIDTLVNGHQGTRFVLLHGGGAHLLELFEMGRMHDHILIDVSFTLMRYAGSSIDQDIRFLCNQLDQRITVGSDMPEYTPAATLERITTLMDGLPIDKQENVLFRNLERLFADWPGMPGI